MTDVWFYHLETRSLEDVLPVLLEKSVGKGWRAIVKCGSLERLEALDRHLWTYDAASFLAHGKQADGHAADQPIYLTLEDDNPNGSAIKFLVDGSTTQSFSDYERLVFIFDGADPDGVAQARSSWKEAKAAGADVTYWRQDEKGQWRKQA